VVLNNSSIPSSAPGLPISWMYAGEKLGTGSGNDGNTNGIVTSIVVNTSNVVNVNFGVNKMPTANDVIATGQTLPINNDTFTLPPLNGGDMEDGTYTGVSKTNTIIIKTLPSNAILYYNGVAVVAGQTITSYDPSKLTIDPTGNTAPLSVSFTYTEVDAGCLESLPATVRIDFSNVVPVSLLSFDAQKHGADKAVLKWITSSEINSKLFEVYRSNDNGTSWSEIGSVDAAGNSNTNINYSLIDALPNQGRNYYRLKMIDIDGSYKWSVVRWVDFGSTGSTTIVMYPNPVSSMLSINGLQLAKEIKVYDAVGRLVDAKLVTNTVEDIDMRRFSQGSYFVVIIGKNGTRISTQKVIKE